MSSRFLQLHFLTTYAANNLNRDDLGRPKSLMFGTAPRLRLSSQCVKRAWRISPVMEAAFAEDKGVRTREFWLNLGSKLVAEGHDEATVVAHLQPILEAILKMKSDAAGEAEGEADEAEGSTEEDAPKAKSKGKGKRAPAVADLKTDLYFYSKAEREAFEKLARESLADGSPMATKKVLPAIGDLPLSGDIALFGRMVAQANSLTVEGAVQVAHPFTVSKVIEEDDYFIAADDLSSQGAGHIAANGFGAGLYYGYVNVDVPLLVKNLDGSKEQARQLLTALIEAIATVAPGGKQNSFSARSYATYLLAEVGSAQPRSFADAFLTPVAAEPLAETAIARLEKAKGSLEKAFPSQVTKHACLNRITEEGSFSDIVALLDELL